MKRLLIALTALLTFSVTTNAMSYEQARQQALFLTDKMAYELNLTEEQYEAAYEINLDYLMSVNTQDDLYGIYWTQRNLDLSYILLDWQYQTYLAATYFYRPLYWEAGYWHFGIYARYPHRDYFYFGRPHFWNVYRGGHSWRMNGGKSWYHGRNFGSHDRAGHGMRDRYDRGDRNFDHGRSGSANGNGSFGSGRSGSGRGNDHGRGYDNGRSGRSNDHGSGAGNNRNNRSNNNRTFGTSTRQNEAPNSSRRENSGMRTNTPSRETRGTGTSSPSRSGFGGNSNSRSNAGSGNTSSRSYSSSPSRSNSTPSRSYSTSPSRSNSTPSRSYSTSPSSGGFSGGHSGGGHSGGGHSGGGRGSFGGRR